METEIKDQPYKDYAFVEAEPGVKDQAWLAANSGIGKRTPRWHFEHEGRVLIVYAESAEEACDAISPFLGKPSSIPAPQASGYYCHVTNTIVDAQDGPTTFVDARKSGGGSRG